MLPNGVGFKGMHDNQVYYVAGFLIIILSYMEVSKSDSTHTHTHTHTALLIYILSKLIFP